MHRVFYRFFGSGFISTACLQIFLGTLIGALGGAWFFAVFRSAYEPGTVIVTLSSDYSAFGVLLCGLLPLFLAGVLSVFGYIKAARILSSAFTAMLLTFSSLFLFWGGSGSSLVTGSLLLCGRITVHVWLLLFLLERSSKMEKHSNRVLLLMLFLSCITLLFFSWLIEPSLRAVSTYHIK